MGDTHPRRLQVYHRGANARVAALTRCWPLAKRKRGALWIVAHARALTMRQRGVLDQDAACGAHRGNRRVETANAVAASLAWVMLYRGPRWIL
jgi:hypothetical protein